MLTFGGRHVLALASRIILPAAAESEAIAIMSQHGLTAPVARLEDLPKSE